MKTHAFLKIPNTLHECIKSALQTQSGGHQNTIKTEALLSCFLQEGRCSSFSDKRKAAKDVQSLGRSDVPGIRTGHFLGQDSNQEPHVEVLKAALPSINNILNNNGPTKRYFQQKNTTSSIHTAYFFH